ncbi:MAG: 2-oxo acid dehydrogenase subunit E2 [Candidatus Hydrogenedentota bacterium]
MRSTPLPVRETSYFDIQRRVAAHKTQESWDEIPHVSLVLELDMTHLLAFRRKLLGSPEFAGTRFTINTLLLKVLAESLRESPRMHAFVGYSRGASTGRVTVLEDINIAIPMLLPSGETITPVLHQVDKKPLRELCAAMEDLKRRVDNTNASLLLFEAGRRDTYQNLFEGRFGVLRRLFSAYLGKGRLHLPPRKEQRAHLQIPATDRVTPDDLTSATVLVSNIGNAVPGMRLNVGLLEVIRPQTTAIAVTPIRKQPVVVTDENGNDRVAIREVCPITVCCDHRAVDFFHIEGFFKKAVAISEEPERWLQ